MVKALEYKIGDKIGNFEILDNIRINGKIKVKCKCNNEMLMEATRIKKTNLCRKCRGGMYPGKIIDGCTLIEKTEKKWKIKCRCGNIYESQPRIDARGGGRFRDCGCTKNKSYWERAQEKIGYKFGKLKVIGIKKIDKHNILICKCKCGNIVEVINGHDGPNGKKQSCGCLKNESLPRGDKASNARFKNYEILTMRELYENNTYSVKELSEMFQTDENYILRIVKGLIWKSLPTPEKNKIKRRSNKRGSYRKSSNKNQNGTPSS